MKKRKVEKVYTIEDFEYDGDYPNLCRGHLKMTINGLKWDFGKYCLSSGGECGFLNGYEDSFVFDGPWTISEWPKNFPEDPILRELVTEEVNSRVRWGCCGGCL